MSELTAYRTLALREAVANNPHVAMTALLHKLCLDTFQHAASGNCLEASVHQVFFSIQPADLKDSPPAKAVAERHEAWKADLPKDEAQLWDWLAVLDDTSRAALLAHCVSFGVNALYEKGDRYGGPGVSIHGVQRRLVQADRLARAVGLCASSPLLPSCSPRSQSGHARRSGNRRKSATMIRLAKLLLSPDPPKPVRIVEIPKLLPLPGQLKPIPGAKTEEAETADPRARVEQANGEARVQPTRAGYINAIQVYPFSDGALYQVYAAPGEITDIALEAGEQLVGSGPVAAGDTVRWVIGDTESGTGPSKQVHILIKPTRPDLVTNLVVNTDRRTYHLELRSAEKTYMASVSWAYASDQLIALRRQNTIAEAAAPVASGVDLRSAELSLFDRGGQRGLAAAARFR